MSTSRAVNNLITNQTSLKEEQESIKEFCPCSLLRCYPARCYRYKTITPASGNMQPKKDEETKVHCNEVT